MKHLVFSKTDSFVLGDWKGRIVHRKGDAAGIHRFELQNELWELELLPSKGLSPGQVSFKGLPFFWDAPIALIDPDSLDLNDDSLMINGKSVPGFSFLRTFASGIELYGLFNWGMPVKDPQSGRLLPLHGESSNIPVEEATLFISEKGLEIITSFIYRSFEGASSLPWYERGAGLFIINRSICIPTEGRQVELNDRIENISQQPQRPDWGYHITFRPEPGSKLILPSRQQQNRDGSPLPANMESWVPAVKEEVRRETGIIHKGLKSFTPGEPPFKGLSRALLKYPGGQGLEITFPRVPYVQTWFCSGGAGSKEFTFKNGEPVFKKSWNGQGLELGSSALDHDGNTDPDLAWEGILAPGESLRIPLLIKVLEKHELEELEQDISSYKQSEI